MRPHIVFFQEAVPNIEPAMELVNEADIFVVIGTSLAVYPRSWSYTMCAPGHSYILYRPESGISCCRYARCHHNKSHSNGGYEKINGFNYSFSLILNFFTLYPLKICCKTYFMLFNI